MFRRSPSLVTALIASAMMIAGCVDSQTPTAPADGPRPALAGVTGLGCVTAPPGLISWWPADGDAADIIGPNDGVFIGGATLAPGLVGQAFSLDGMDDWVEVPDHPSLSFGNSADDHESLEPSLSAEEWSEPEMLKREKAVLGFYVTRHPFRRQFREAGSAK